MKSSNYIIIGLVFAMAIFGVLWGTGSLSVIGEGVSETCRINLTTNQCTVELTLPEYRSVHTYTLDLDFISVPGAFENKVQVTPISGLGPLYEEDDNDESSSMQELESNYLYLYRLPSAWDVDDIYSVKMEASTPGWISTSRTSSSVELSMYFRMVNKPYTLNTIQKCGENYDINTCIVRHYDRDYSRDPNEWKYYEYNLASLPTKSTGDDLDTDDRDYDPYYPNKWNGNLASSTSFILKDKMELYGITNAKTEMAIMIHMDADEREKGYTNFGMTVPPMVFMTYASELQPTNTVLQVGITQIQTFTGQPDNATTNDLANTINTYCSTRAVGDKCTVPLTFTSLEDGIIKVTAETGQLRATSQETGRSGGNLLTGFAVGNSFDFEEHPIQAYTTVGILFLLVMVGIFTIGGKKK